MDEKLRKQSELEDRILEVIDNADDYTRSDLQGVVSAVIMDAMKYRGSDEAAAIYANLSKLPEECYAVLPSDKKKVIKIKRGVNGFYPTTLTPGEAMAVNQAENVTAYQLEAMLAGSMFGWHIPAADINTYILHDLKKAGKR